MENNETLDLYYFKNKPEDYERTITPIKEYLNQASMYLSKRKKISKEEALKEIKTLLKNSKVNNPIIRYNTRLNNGDLKEDHIKTTDYLKDVLENNELMAPSWTSYKNPDILQSLHGDFLVYNVKERSRYKKEQFIAAQNNDPVKYSLYNTLQKTKKVYNNSLSGAYASKSTILYNPSSHSTLTSMTRCVASIGNSISESIIFGNKHFRKPELVYNYITAIISNINKEEVENCIKIYNLYIPKISDVMDMIIKSIKWYWRDTDIEKDIEDYLSCLEDYELTAVLYVNDLYHLRKHNDKLVRDMLSELKERKTGLTEDTIYLEKSAEGVEILSKIINADLIKGKVVNYKELKGTEILSSLASTAMNICKVLDKYKILFKTLLTTPILPISIAYIKDMMRECIVLSDTDSTCGSYGEWVNWYYGNNDFNSDSISLSAAVMTINTQAMDHNIKVYAKNMNIPLDKFDYLKMKNEFFWSSFVPSNVSKHYFASTLIQEGNVYRKADFELKGAHFIASAVNQYVVNKVHDMLKEVNDLVYNNKKLELHNYVKRVADLERYVLNMIDSGDMSIYSKATIKDGNSYKQGLEESVYWNHLLWKEVFEEKYGSPGEPPYMFIKIPTTLKTNKKLKDFLSSIKDDNIRERLTTSLEKRNKTMFGVFRPPLSICISKGIPEEFISVIDTFRVIEDNLRCGYLFLETLGFYKKDYKLLMDMGY